METVLTQAGTIIVKVGFDKAGAWIKNLSKKKALPIEELKKKVRILFVDDEDFSARLKTISEAGWSITQIKDVTNFNSEEIKTADIIFMDYIGVGQTLTPSEQGIGLVKSLKERYPEKMIIFYSGYAGFIPGHEIHSIADSWIDKHSDPYVYIDHIEDCARKIYG